VVVEKEPEHPSHPLLTEGPYGDGAFYA
jgi:hypothetical protein